MDRYKLSTLLQDFEIDSFKTGDKEIIAIAKEMIEQASNDYNICKHCIEPIEEVIHDGKDVVEYCGCKRRVSKW